MLLRLNSDQLAHFMNQGRWCRKVSKVSLSHSSSLCLSRSLSHTQLYLSFSQTHSRSLSFSSYSAVGMFLAKKTDRFEAFVAASCKVCCAPRLLVRLTNCHHDRNPWSVKWSSLRDLTLKILIWPFHLSKPSFSMNVCRLRPIRNPLAVKRTGFK